MTQPDPTTDLHMITLCHSGNGKHFTEVTIDYKGADGHAKTDSDDIIPAYPGFEGQNLDADGLYRLEHACQARPLPTTTTTLLSTTTTVTTLPTTSTTVKPATTTTTTGPTSTTTQTTVPTTQTTETTEWQHEATTTTAHTTTVQRPTSTTTAPKTDGTTINSIQSMTTTPASTLTVPTAPSHESLPVTGASPEGLLIGAAVLLMAGALFIKRGKR